MTPHVALFSYGVLILVVGDRLQRDGTTPLTIFGDAGTLAAFGFLFAYYMISIATPFYLRKLGSPPAPSHCGRGRGVLVPARADGRKLLSLRRPHPVNLFPYIFLGYMLLGAAQLYRMHRLDSAVAARDPA